MIFYALKITPLDRPKLVERRITYQYCHNGGIKIRDDHGLQYVKPEYIDTLEVFEVNETIVVIVEEGSFQKNLIYKSLASYHRKMIDQNIAELKKMKRSL